MKKELKKVTSLTNKASLRALCSIYNCTGKAALLLAECKLLMNMADWKKEVSLLGSAPITRAAEAETHPEKHCNSGTVVKARMSH